MKTLRNATRIDQAPNKAQNMYPMAQRREGEHVSFSSELILNCEFI